MLKNDWFLSLHELLLPYKPYLIGQIRVLPTMIMKLVFVFIIIFAQYVSTGDACIKEAEDSISEDSSGLGLGEIMEKKIQKINKDNPQITDFKLDTFNPKIEENELVISFENQQDLYKDARKDKTSKTKYDKVPTVIKIFIGKFTLKEECFTNDVKVLTDVCQGKIMSNISKTIKDSSFIFNKKTFVYFKQEKEECQCHGQAKDLLNEIYNNLKNVDIITSHLPLNGKPNFSLVSPSTEFLVNISNLTFTDNESNQITIPIKFDSQIPNPDQVQIQAYNPKGEPVSILKMIYPADPKNYKNMINAIESYYCKVKSISPKQKLRLNERILKPLLAELGNIQTPPIPYKLVSFDSSDMEHIKACTCQVFIRVQEYLKKFQGAIQKNQGFDKENFDCTIPKRKNVEDFKLNVQLTSKNLGSLDWSRFKIIIPDSSAHQEVACVPGSDPYDSALQKLLIKSKQFYDARKEFHFFIRYSGTEKSLDGSSLSSKGVIYLGKYKTANHGGLKILHEYLVSKYKICQVLKPSEICLNKQNEYTGGIIETIKNIQKFLKSDNLKFLENPTQTLEKWIEDEKLKRTLATSTTSSSNNNGTESDTTTNNSSGTGSNATNSTIESTNENFFIIPDEFPLPNRHILQQFSIYISPFKIPPVAHGSGLECKEQGSSQGNKPIALPKCNENQYPSDEERRIKTPFQSFILKIKEMATIMKFSALERDYPFNLPTIEKVRTDVISALNSSDQLKDGILTAYKDSMNIASLMDPSKKLKASNILSISSSPLNALIKHLETQLASKYQIDRSVEPVHLDISNYKFDLDFNQLEIITQVSKSVSFIFDRGSHKILGMAKEKIESPDPINEGFSILYDYKKNNLLKLIQLSKPSSNKKIDLIDLGRIICEAASKESYLVHGYLEQVTSKKYSGEIRKFVEKINKIMTDKFKFNNSNQGVIIMNPPPKDLDLKLKTMTFINAGGNIKIPYDCTIEKKIPNDKNSRNLHPLPPQENPSKDTTKGAIAYQLRFQSTLLMNSDSLLLILPSNPNLVNGTLDRKKIKELSFSIGIGTFQAQELDKGIAINTFKQRICSTIENSNHVFIRDGKVFTQTLVNNLPFQFVTGDFESLIAEINNKITADPFSFSSNVNIGSVDECPIGLDCSNYEKMRVDKLDDIHLSREIKEIEITSFNLKFENQEELTIKCDGLKDKPLNENRIKEHELNVKNYGIESISSAVITFKGKELLDPRLTRSSRDLIMKFDLKINENDKPITFQDFVNQICKTLFESNHIEQGRSYGYIPFDLEKSNQDSYIGSVSDVRDELKGFIEGSIGAKLEPLNMEIVNKKEDGSIIDFDVENWIAEPESIDNSNVLSLDSSIDLDIPPPPDAPPGDSDIPMPPPDGSNNSDIPMPPPPSDIPMPPPDDSGAPPPPPPDGSDIPLPPDAPSLSSSSNSSQSSGKSRDFLPMPRNQVSVRKLIKPSGKTILSKSRFGTRIPRRILFEMHGFQISYKVGIENKMFENGQLGPFQNFYSCTENNSDLNYVGKRIHHVDKKKSIEYLAVDTEIANKRAYLALNQNNLIFRNYESDRLEKLFLNFNQFQQTFNDQVQNQREGTLNKFKDNVSLKHKNLKKLGNKVKGQTNTLKTQFERLKSMKESFEEHLKEFSFAAMDWEATYKGSNEKVVIEESTVSSLVKKAIKTAKESGMSYEKLWEYMEKISDKERESRRLPVG